LTWCKADTTLAPGYASLAPGWCQPDATLAPGWCMPDATLAPGWCQVSDDD